MVVNLPCVDMAKSVGSDAIYDGLHCCPYPSAIKLFLRNLCQSTKPRQRQYYPPVVTNERACYYADNRRPFFQLCFILLGQQCNARDERARHEDKVVGGIP
jgi:hypothetical protein